MVSRYAIKIIYQLRCKGKTQREIKRLLKQIYGLNVTQTDVNFIAYKVEIKYLYSDMEKNRLLYLYHNYHDTHKLVNYMNNKYGYNLTYRKLVDYAHANNVRKKFQNMYSIANVSRKDEHDIIDLYNSGYSSNEIAKIYGYKTRNSILQKLDKFQVSKRGCNELRQISKSYSSFSMESIDCKEKAYFLGLLLTDGYSNYERGYIGLEMTDLDVIGFISKYINIRYTTIEATGKAKLNKYRITIYSRQLLEQVQRLGIISNKTYDTAGPQIYNNESRYIPYIIRGIIDGDGWIRNDGKEFFICSASQKFIDWCRSMMIFLGFINIKVKFISNEFNGIYVIRTGESYNLDLLKNLIYDAPFGMSRKYNRLHMKDVQRL